MRELPGDGPLWQEQRRELDTGKILKHVQRIPLGRPLRCSDIDSQSITSQWIGDD